MTLVWTRIPLGYQAANLPDGQKFIIKWPSSLTGEAWYLFHTHTDGIERLVILSASSDLKEVKEYAENHLRMGCRVLPTQQPESFRYCLENDYKEDA